MIPVGNCVEVSAVRVPLRNSRATPPELVFDPFNSAAFFAGTDGLRRRSGSRPPTPPRRYSLPLALTSTSLVNACSSKLVGKSSVHVAPRLVE
ncbi:MAG: DUF397 domain-containing protein [Candidatus Binataceae bacterium]|nr:DUF397 domain-containing protein [Candidatus Binataceae bacterium]